MWNRTLAAVLLLSATILGCAPRYPEATDQQVRAALSDAFLVTSSSMLLPASADTSVTDRAAIPDGSMVLAWGSIDPARGIGRYTLTLSEYAVPGESRFAAAYHGYLLSGTATMGSEDGEHTTIELDLTASHPEPEANPVQRIEARISGITPQMERPISGEAQVNGRSVELDTVAELFAAPPVRSE